MCAMIKRGTFYPVKTIVGKDLDVGATFNADITSTPVGIVPAGRIMIYNPTTGAVGGIPAKTMAPWNGAFTGAGSITDATDVGLLAQDTDSTPTIITGNVSVTAVGMIYRKGTFLLQEVEEANMVGDAEGGFRGAAAITFLQILQRKGIFFEFSWEGYGLMERPPTPIPPIP